MSYSGLREQYAPYHNCPSCVHTKIVRDEVCIKGKYVTTFECQNCHFKWNNKQEWRKRWEEKRNKTDTSFNSPSLGDDLLF